MTLDEAVELFRAAEEEPPPVRRPRTVLNALGARPASDKAMQVLSGRYGPYVTDGTTNASLPKGADPATLTIDEAVELLKAREAAGPSRRRAPAAASARGARAAKPAGARKARAKPA